MDGQAIFTAKGMPKQRRSMLIKMALWGLGTAAFVFLLSQMKVNHDFQSLFTQQGYILTERARVGMYFLGSIYLLFSIGLLLNLFLGNQSYISIYEDHIDGCFCPFITKKNFTLTYEQIMNVQILDEGYLEITTFGCEYKCVLDDVYEACKRIREQLLNR